ncbi:MAG: cytochrome c3 family protein [Candidatus Hodarchaeales archaeon]
MSNPDNIKSLEVQSRRNAKRVVLMYWLALFFLGSGVAVGLGFQVINPRFVAPNDEYHDQFIGVEWHPENCSGCHAANYNEWKGTAHGGSEYFTNATDQYVNTTGGVLIPIGTFNASCAHCMATRSANVSGTITYWDIGVTCAACHDAPGVINHTATPCGQCHITDDVRPRQYGDYLKSAHYNTLSDLLARPEATDSCLHCMAGQGLYADEIGFNLTLSNPALVTITCATCHDPHNAQHPMQLRKEDSTELCGSCHQEAADMFTGEADNSPSLHYEYGVECTSCHGYQMSTRGVYTNHTWILDRPLGPDCAGCHGWEFTCKKSGCHVTFSESKIVSWFEGEANISALLNEYTELLANVTTKVDEAKDTPRVSMTKIDSAYDLIDDAQLLFDFVNGDPHRGSQNPTLAATKMLTAINKLNLAYNLADEAIAEIPSEEPSSEEPSSDEGDEGTPGFEIVGVLAILSLLSILALLVRRKEY